jgi:hypothetical protein
MRAFGLIASMFVVALVAQLLLGLVGDDAHEVWSRPLAFGILFVVLFAIIYLRERNAQERR